MEDLSKYFKDRGCDYWYEYQESYGDLNVREKTIQLIGGDCGSSALFLLLNGAEKVVQYEKDNNKNELFKNAICHEFNICNDVEIKGEWKGGYEDTNIFIMDCEGCEGHIDLTKLDKYELSCIAVHEWTKNRTKLLKEMKGWKLQFTSADGKELMFCKSR